MNILKTLLLAISFFMVVSAFAEPPQITLEEYFICERNANFVEQVAQVRDLGTSREAARGEFIGQWEAWNESHPDKPSPKESLDHTLFIVDTVYTHADMTPKTLAEGLFASCVEDYIQARKSQ